MTIATQHPAVPREVASEVLPRELADDRTFTETEVNGIVTERARQETAALASEKAALETEKAALEERVTVLETEKAAAEARAEVAEAEAAQAKADHEAYVAEQEAKVETARLAVERADKVREVATLPEAFFTDERKASWAAMEQATFDSLLETLGATAAGKTPAKEKASAVTGAPIHERAGDQGGTTGPSLFNLLGSK